MALSWAGWEPPKWLGRGHRRECRPGCPRSRPHPDGLFRLARKADRKAHRRLRTGLASVDDLALHRARKAAKRARYAAELVAPLPGTKAAKAAIKHHKKVQTVLGEHQDSVVALDLLRRLGAEAGTTPGQNGFTYGLLYAHQQTAARRSRAAATSPADQRLARTSSNRTSPGRTTNSFLLPKPPAVDERVRTEATNDEQQH